jgi:hypothetical protein
MYWNGLDLHTNRQPLGLTPLGSSQRGPVTILEIKMNADMHEKEIQI